MTSTFAAAFLGCWAAIIAAQLLLGVIRAFIEWRGSKADAQTLALEWALKQRGPVEVHSTQVGDTTIRTWDLTKLEQRDETGNWMPFQPELPFCYMVQVCGGLDDGRPRGATTESEAVRIHADLHQQLRRKVGLK